MKCLDEARDQDSKYRDQDIEAQDQDSKNAVSRLDIISRLPITEF